MEGHSGPVLSVAFSPDGRKLASGSYDCKVRLFDSCTGEGVQTLAGHRGFVTSVSFSLLGMNIATGSYDNTVKLWNSATGECVRSFLGHSGAVMSVAFSADGKEIISQSHDNTEKHSNSVTGECVRTSLGHSGPVMSVAISADEKDIISQSLDNRVKNCNSATGESPQQENEDFLEISQNYSYRSLSDNEKLNPDGNYSAEIAGDRIIVRKRISGDIFHISLELAGSEGAFLCKNSTFKIVWLKMGMVKEILCSLNS